MAVFADVLRKPFGTMKIIFDVIMVVFTAAFSWFAFGLLTGNGTTVIIREGTLILALFTGMVMRLTDRYINKVFGPLVPRHE